MRDVMCGCGSITRRRENWTKKTENHNSPMDQKIANEAINSLWDAMRPKLWVKSYSSGLLLSVSLNDGLRGRTPGIATEMRMCAKWTEA